MIDNFLDEIELGVLEIVPVALLIFSRSGDVIRSNSQWKSLARQIGLSDETRDIKEIMNFLNIPLMTDEKQTSVYEINIAGKTVIIKQNAILLQDSDLFLLSFEDITRFKSHIKMVHSQVSETLWKFRSRTAAIQNALSILIDYDSELTEIDRSNLLKESQFETWQISRYADNLRDISLLNARLLQDQLELEPVSIKEMVSEAIQNLKMFIEYYGKGCDINDKTDKTLMVIADRNRLVRIFESIIINSIVFSAENVNISISTICSDTEICLSIKDNGRGIDEEDLPKIFDYGYKGKTALKSKYNGMGIELYLAREILSKMNGSISIQSGKNIGTTVEMILFRGNR